MIELCKRPMKILSLLVLLFATGNNMNLIIVNGAFTSSSPFQRTTTTTASPINQVNSKFMGKGMNVNVQYKASSSNQKNNHRRGNMSMFLGQDGILGVGAPEIAVTLLVGYFILGPSELYKLTKEIGKFIQSFRTLSSEASKSFESSMESQLELQELRKAQSELNNAFSFRRSINVDQDGEAFSEAPPMADNVAATDTTTTAAAAAAAASTGTSEEKKTKKRKRIKRKKQQSVPTLDENDIPPFSGDIPDLDMTEEFKKEMKEQLWSKPDDSGFDETEVEAVERLRAERLDRLQNGQPSTPPPTTDWYDASEADIAKEVLNGEAMSQPSPAEIAAEQSRFASQLSGDWNSQILANEEKLSPLGKIMERLAILEEEKNAADARLEEEFRLRAENEEKFYREKRKVLEEASAEVAAATYNFDVEEDDKEEEKEEKMSTAAKKEEIVEMESIGNSTNATMASMTTDAVKEENSTKV